MERIKIATLQMNVTADKKECFRYLETLFENHKDLAGADIVTLPEMFCCPYNTASFPIYAEPEGGFLWESCSAFARRHQVYLSAGSIPESDQSGHIYNTAWVFDRQGNQIAKHRKMHLFDIQVEGGQHFKESDTLTPGNQLTVFDTEYGKMGLCICYDIRFPEIFRMMALQGARIILVPAAFNMTTGPAHWELLFRARAVDNQVYMIGTASARDAQADYTSWGHSIITNPWGTVVMQMDASEQTALTELDLDMTEQMRAQIPVLKHLRNDLYKTELL